MSCEELSVFGCKFEATKNIQVTGSLLATQPTKAGSEAE